ncbi:cyclic nucleotide-binding domain-containing protein [Fontisphaera persica]|uniref:ATP-binding protein n=1 Tax=Fontisphaera persica TaxID=2974023 RepID=UPI0024C01B1F|nr:ATP-binding protein [Fontisphaera persica]WCJ59484.1 cyclic nucleotide-binding domain-containing protein [Fontisphaera persica]
MMNLEDCKLLADLPPHELAQIRQAARELSFAPGQTIFKEGDQGDGVYLVRAGEVEISALVGQGDRRPISRIGPGEMFGEMAVIDSEPRSASATAVGDVQAWFISRDELWSLLERSPVLSRHLMREISRRLREFNRQYIREVIQAERLALVGRFARSIVHDLKNPLNIIGIAADMMGLENATAESRAIARKRIRKQVDRISAMVNELLEYTRTAQTTTVLAATDYAAFVMPLLEEIAAEITVKRANLKVPEPAPSVIIAANPQRLSRVFYNLVHNATDAMPQGGDITVRFRVRDGRVITEIQDSGTGIPEEILPRMFEPFFTHGKAQGTGLGLSICKRIIEDHQGTIEARNAPAGGAVISFSLPVQSAVS